MCSLRWPKLSRIGQEQADLAWYYQDAESYSKESPERHFSFSGEPSATKFSFLPVFMT